MRKYVVRNYDKQLCYDKPNSLQFIMYFVCVNVVGCIGTIFRDQTMFAVF